MLFVEHSDSMTLDISTPHCVVYVYCIALQLNEEFYTRERDGGDVKSDCVCKACGSCIYMYIYNYMRAVNLFIKDATCSQTLFIKGCVLISGVVLYTSLRSWDHA